MGLFFGTVFGIYFIINAYMFARLFMTLAGCGAVRAIACVAFLLFAASFPAGRLLAHRMPAPAADVLILMGSLYLSPMIYGFLLSVAADAFGLLNSVVAITHNPPPFSPGVRMCSVFAIFAASIAITLAGAWNANTPVVVAIDIPAETDPAAAPSDVTTKIALLSDIHLGRLTGPKYLKKLVEKTNAQDPDIILLLGDTIDDESFFRDAERMSAAAEALSSFKSRLGAWAVLGNHDYYAGDAQVSDFLSRAGVTLLRDEAAVVSGELILIGRDDRSASLRGFERKSIEEIAASSPPLQSDAPTLPTIVMDHQPFGLEEAESAGATLQVSGHTHRGQLFPVNFIVAFMYEKHYGLYKRGKTNYYITSGAGVWGPPVRTAGRPEIVMLNLGHSAKEVGER
ncbi:MAG: metallophosphoesterase [Synergistaceae bacterium]|nr:metallophosphoesterase [Synergistaceae bacterium]